MMAIPNETRPTIYTLRSWMKVFLSLVMGVGAILVMER